MIQIKLNNRPQFFNETHFIPDFPIPNQDDKFTINHFYDKHL